VVRFIQGIQTWQLKLTWLSTPL